MGPRMTEFVDFDIDNYLNRFVPYPRISRLPKPISRFLGYREQTYKEPPHLIVCLWSFIGAMSGLLLVGALYRFAPGLAKYNPPVIVASLGAGAILDYNAIRAPLAQPRNAIFGQTFSAIIGVAISKAFQHSDRFEDLQWVAGALCCATASFVMSVTGTVHPPGGATAILAATNAPIIKMGWVFVPFIMLSTVMMLMVALIVNNIQRGYPVYWWTPRDLRAKKVEDVKEGNDLEKVETSESQLVLRGRSISPTVSEGTEAIVVDAHGIHLPNMFDLDSDEIAVLHRLQARLRWDLALDERPSFSGSGPG